MAQAADAVTLEEVLMLARRLSPRDKVRLIERIAPDIEREVAEGQPSEPAPLRGLWRGVDVTDDDLAGVRRDMWDTFTHADI